MRALICLVAALQLGCVSASSTAPDPELVDAVRMCLLTVENGSHLTIVLPASFDVHVRHALESIRTVVAPSEVPVSKHFVLPAGYLEVYELRVSKQEAVFSGTRGPVPRQPARACGYGYFIRLNKSRSGSWQVASQELKVC